MWCAGLVLTARGIFPDQGLNPAPLHWQVASRPRSHQGSLLLFHQQNLELLSYSPLQGENARSARSSYAKRLRVCTLVCLPLGASPAAPPGLPSSGPPRTRGPFTTSSTGSHCDRPSLFPGSISFLPLASRPSHMLFPLPGTALLPSPAPGLTPLPEGSLLSPICKLREHGSDPQVVSDQFSSVAQSCRTLCDPMNHSTPGLPVHHQLPESTQTHVH